MAAEVTPLQQLRLPSGPSPITAEQRYWKTFKSQLVSAAGSSITHISYPAQQPSSSHSSSSSSSSSSPDLFAVTSGNRVQLYSIRTRKVVKTISRFTTTARSGEIRRDGRIVAAGDDDGRIQVFDTSSRAILKTWDAHKPLPVWTVRFSPSELTTLMSCSDDKTVRLWDLPSNGPVTTFNGHTDYVRSGSFIPNNSHVVVSGSYDSTVRVWDARAPHKPVLTFRHDAAIEAVLPMPSGTTVLAASGSQISVLDLVAAKPQHVISNHQKTVMSLSLASGGRRLVSGGLDGHVKIFETSGWNVVAGLKYSAPVHAVSVIPLGVAADGTSQDRHLAVATFAKSSSFLSLRTRLSGPDAARQREREKEMQALLSGSIAQYDSAKLKRKRQQSSRQKMDELAAAADAIIGADMLTGSKRRRKEARWQKFLRHGRFGDALNLVLDKQAPDHTPLNVLTLLTALRHRSALRDALADRDEESVMPVMHWVCAHISDPRYVSVCVDAALLLIDLYAEYASQSPELEQAFRTLYRRVKTEVERAQAAAQTGGMLESLILGGSV